MARTQDMTNNCEIFQPWQLSHRIDLHEALKSSATSPDGPGIPAIIHLRSKVIGCDPDAPSVILDDGEVVQGDLLIGADGVHVRKLFRK